MSDDSTAPGQSAQPTRWRRLLWVAVPLLCGAVALVALCGLFGTWVERHTDGPLRLSLIPLALGCLVLTLGPPLWLGVRWARWSRRRKEGARLGRRLSIALSLWNLALISLAVQLIPAGLAGLWRQEGRWLARRVVGLWSDAPPARPTGGNPATGTPGTAPASRPAGSAKSASGAADAKRKPDGVCNRKGGSCTALVVSGDTQPPRPLQLTPAAPGARKDEPAAGWRPPRRGDAVPDKAADGGLGRLLRQARQAVVQRPDFIERWNRMEQEARQGQPKAQLMLGAMLCQGLVVQRDVPAGLHWLQRAALAGSADAAHALGRLYRRGKVVDKDPRLALAWFHRAAAAGHVKSMQRVGWAVINGQGTEQDVDEGLRWYRDAARAGSRRAMVALGGEYWYANRVLRDRAEARRWYAMAAAKGSHHARDRIDEMDGKWKPRRPKRRPKPAAGDAVAVDPWRVVQGLYGAAARSARRERERRRAQSFRNTELVGRPAPPLEAEDALGHTVTLARPGQPVWVSFVSPRCSRSHRFSPLQARLARRYAGRARFLAVLSGPARQTFATRADARAWAERYDLDLASVLVDPHDRYSRGLGLGPTPHHVLVDRGGVVRKMMSGAASEAEFTGALEPLLK